MSYVWYIFPIDSEQQFAFPTEIMLTASYPDIVIWSVDLKKGFRCRINRLLKKKNISTKRISVSWKKFDDRRDYVSEMAG